MGTTRPKVLQGVDIDHFSTGRPRFCTEARPRSCKEVSAEVFFAKEKTFLCERPRSPSHSLSSPLFSSLLSFFSSSKTMVKWDQMGGGQTQEIYVFKDGRSHLSSMAGLMGSNGGRSDPRNLHFRGWQKSCFLDGGTYQTWVFLAIKENRQYLPKKGKGGGGGVFTDE